MKHTHFSHMGRSWSYLDLPKQSWYYFWFSSSVFQAPEDSHWRVPMCLWGLSLPCMFVAFLAPCWYESQGVFTFFFLTRHAFGNLIYRICISRLVHGSFFTLPFLYSSGSCTRSAAPCLLGKLPFPRCHFSVMVARELSDSFHPQHFKNIFTWKLGNCDDV